MAGRLRCEQDGRDGGEAVGVLSGEYQAQEMSTMVSALARVVSGGYDGWEEHHPAMGGYVHAQGGYGYPATAPTPDRLAAVYPGMADTALSLNVEAGELAAAAMRGHRWVEYMVCTVGLATAFMSVALAVYKVPAGIFDGHKLAYYVSVVSAGVVGLAEACTAVVWLSAGVGSTDATEAQRQRLARRCVLCAALLPLTFMAGLGGLRILVK